jgi:hypothetical protein
LLFLLLPLALLLSLALPRGERLSFVFLLLPCALSLCFCPLYFLFLLLPFALSRGERLSFVFLLLPRDTQHGFVSAPCARIAPVFAQRHAGKRGRKRPETNYFWGLH